MFPYVQTDSRIHPVSFPMDTGGSFLGETSDHLTPSTGKESVDIYLHAPYISPLRGS
jgi:hypothetical protein